MKTALRNRVVLPVLVITIFVACQKKSGPVGQEGGAATPPSMTTTPAGPLPPEEAAIVVKPSKRPDIKYTAEGTPTRAIQDLDDMLDSYILDAKTPEDRKYNAALKRTVIHGTFDIRELCHLALDKHWAEIKTSDQDYFVDLMLRLLERKAIFSKEQGQKKQKQSKAEEKALYKLVYNGDKFTNADKTQAVAQSHVLIPSEAMKIEINYKLKKVGGAWKIYDVVVDGASLLDNYKYQFDKIIAKDGYPTLVHRMESKFKELQEQDVQPAHP